MLMVVVLMRHMLDSFPNMNALPVPMLRQVLVSLGASAPFWVVLGSLRTLEVLSGVPGSILV